MTRDGKPVANRDAWERLEAASRRLGGVHWPQPGADADEIFKSLDPLAREARDGS
jgi:ribonuclease HI